MIAFGPVPSRRLGFSLGINNIQTPKTCSYECVYCQLGMTSGKTIIPSAQYDPDTLVKAVKDHLKKLSGSEHPDYLTFVSQGEPTLDNRLGTSIDRLKVFGIPVAVITNASLLDRIDVREQLMQADWVSLKIDTLDERIWKKINRPCSQLSLHKILEGICLFTSRYTGKLHTETMLIKDLNDSTRSLEKTAAFIAGLNPATAYISIPTRPPAKSGTCAADASKLTEAWEIFESYDIKTELLAGFEGTHTGYTGNAWDDILNITAVHPLRNDTLKELLQNDKAEMSVVTSLLKQRLLKKVSYQGNTYYTRYYPGVYKTG